MLYLFAGVSRQHYDPTRLERLSIHADNEQQARAKLARDYVLVFAGQINQSAHQPHFPTQGGVA